MTENEKVEVLKENLDALADHVAVLSEIGKMIEKSRLKQKTLILLLQQMTKLPQRDIMLVLDALPKLEQEFLKKQK